MYCSWLAKTLQLISHTNTYNNNTNSKRFGSCWRQAIEAESFVITKAIKHIITTATKHTHTQTYIHR